MILKAKITKASEPKDRTSEATGKTYKNRSVILNFSDEEGEEYIRASVDEEVWQELGLREGEEMTLRIRFYTKTTLSGNVKNIALIVPPQNIQ